MSDYENIQGSLLKKTNDLGEQLGCSSQNFDAVHDITSLPTHDSIGLASLTTQESDVGYNFSAMFVVTTSNDTNNMRLSSLVGSVGTACKKETTWDLLDMVTGEVLGFIVLKEGTTILPVTQPTDTRVAQAIQFSGFCVLEPKQS